MVRVGASPVDGAKPMTIEDTPRRSSLRHCARIFAVLCLHFVAGLLVLIVLCRIVPAYSRFYGRADIALPPPTTQVIRLSELCTAFLGRIVLLGIVADGAVVVLLASRAPARQWLLSAYSQLWLIGVIVLLVCVAIATAVPVMNDLIQPLGSAAGPGT